MKIFFLIFYAIIIDMVKFAGMPPLTKGATYIHPVNAPEI